MAIDNFTEYLGKKVEFFSPVAYPYGKLYKKVSGVIDGVVLTHPDITESEFFVDSETYVFSDVVFINKPANLVVF